jgi:hypothetical protein
MAKEYIMSLDRERVRNILGDLALVKRHEIIRNALGDLALAESYPACVVKALAEKSVPDGDKEFLKKFLWENFPEDRELIMKF